MIQDFGGTFSKLSQLYLPLNQLDKKTAPKYEIHRYKTHLKLYFSCSTPSKVIQYLTSLTYLSDSDMGFILKMEKNTIFVLEMMVKSGLEKFILKSLPAGR